MSKYFSPYTIVLFIFLFFSGAMAASAGDAKKYVRSAAAKYGVSPNIALKVCKVESTHCHCNTRRGRAGEVGPMQILPRTARGMGMSVKGCQNQVNAGVRYLQKALNRGGVWKYNAGIYAKKKSKYAARYERLVNKAKP